jgi:flagellar basal-body rod protein FlgC
MSFFTSLRVTGSALAVERLRVDLASSNLANASSTQSVEGGPYRRRDAVIRAVSLDGGFGTALDRAVRAVSIQRIQLDPRPPREVFDPGHPDADAEGIVRLPNVAVAEEIVNLRTAQRAYEANLSALSASREMALRALRAGRSA